MSAQCPVYSRKRTLVCAVEMSVQCHNRTFALHQKSRYWINSSAVTGSLSGTVSPSSFTVLRLIASSNVVGCGTGSCDGLAPLRIRPA